MAVSGAGYEAWDKTTGTTVLKPWPGIRDEKTPSD